MAIRFSMRTIGLILMTSSSLMAISSCSDERWHEEYRQIQVDSLVIERHPGASDTLCMSFYGLIGASSCSSFSHFDVVRDSFSLELTLWGVRRWEHEDDCRLPVAFHLNGRQYCTTSLYPGMMHVLVHQPDGSVLRDSVRVL